MGFQIYICPILRIFWSILESVVFICQRVPANLKCFFYRRLYSTSIDWFVGDSSRLHLTFVAFGLLSVICKQCLKQCNYSVDQSALLNGFRTYFTSWVWNFCRWVPDVPPRETFPAAKSEEKRMFSQASKPGVVLPYMTCALARGTDQTTPFPGPPFFPSPRLVNC